MVVLDPTMQICVPGTMSSRTTQRRLCPRARSKTRSASRRSTRCARGNGAARLQRGEQFRDKGLVVDRRAPERPADVVDAAAVLALPANRHLPRHDLLVPVASVTARYVRFSVSNSATEKASISVAQLEVYE